MTDDSATINQKLNKCLEENAKLRGELAKRNADAAQIASYQRQLTGYKAMVQNLKDLFESAPVPLTGQRHYYKWYQTMRKTVFSD